MTDGTCIPVQDTFFPYWLYLPFVCKIITQLCTPWQITLTANPRFDMLLHYCWYAGMRGKEYPFQLYICWTVVWKSLSLGWSGRWTHTWVVPYLSGSTSNNISSERIVELPLNSRITVYIQCYLNDGYTFMLCIICANMQTKMSSSMS